MYEECISTPKGQVRPCAKFVEAAPSASNNIPVTEIALRLEELLPHINGNLGSNMAGYIKQVLNAVIAQLRNR
jgi:hypothetical protein